MEPEELHKLARETRCKIKQLTLLDLAADATFRKFNPALGPDCEELDLHRLSVPQAKKKIEEHLPAAAAAVVKHNKASCGSLWVTVVTGKGNHSVGPPKLGKAVRSWLQEQGMCWEQEGTGRLKVDAYEVLAKMGPLARSKTTQCQASARR